MEEEMRFAFIVNFDLSPAPRKACQGGEKEI
jgi:hypothetical protein